MDEQGLTNEQVICGAAIFATVVVVWVKLMAHAMKDLNKDD